MAFEVGRPIPGMPDDLAAAVWQQLGPVEVEIAIENWNSLGESDRNAYRSYLDESWTRRGRRARCRVVARQLLDPSKGLFGELGL